MACRPVFILNVDRGLRNDRWYAKRADDHQISARNGATHSFPIVDSRGMCAHIPCTMDEEQTCEGKIATARRSGRKHVKNERERVVYAGGTYGWTSMPLFTIVALRTESHLKSTQFFKDSLTRNRSGPCASSPPLAPHRGGFAVVCACFATLLSCATFSKRYVVFALFADLCERRTLPILDVFQRAYELRRLLMRAAT